MGLINFYIESLGSAFALGEIPCMGFEVLSVVGLAFVVLFKSHLAVADPAYLYLHSRAFLERDEVVR